MIRRFAILSLFLFANVSVAVAQSYDNGLWREMMELWAEQNESEAIPDDYIEMMQGYAENPINLNDTCSDALEDLFFLSDLQRAELKAYIAQNGQMASLAELYLLNSMDSATVRMLCSFATAAPVDNEHIGIGQMMKRGHSWLTVGTKRVFPSGRGYEEDLYAGSPFRLYFKYNFTYSNRVSFQFSGEKDAGEAFVFGTQNRASQLGFDCYGYNLMFNYFGAIKRAVLGKYQLQFGQGLTMWSGFAPWLSENMPLRRYGTGIRKASAFCEYGYLRGGAATISLLPARNRQTLEMTVFYSNVDRDVTLSADDSLADGRHIFQSLYQTGLHRTENELSKRNRLNEQLLGGHLQYRNSGFLLGGTIYGMWFDNMLEPVDYIYNRFAFRGKSNMNCGIDATYSLGNLLFFGEASMSCNDEVRRLSKESGWLPVAAVAGLQMQMGSDNLLSLAYRYGSPTYQNLYSNAIGQSSSASNENGFQVFFKSTLPYYIHLQLFADFFRYPYMRYRVYAPSSGAEYRVKVCKELIPNAMLDCQYRYKVCQRNGSEQLYSVETVCRQQLQFSLDYSSSSEWRFLSRVSYSWFDSEEEHPQKGFMIFQEVDYRSKVGKRPLVLGAQLALFDISDYDARIYSYESDMLYEYNVSMYNGRGVRGFFICRYEFGPQLSVALKYAVTYYPDQESIGSGYETITGNNKQEVKAQLHWRF